MKKKYLYIMLILSLLGCASKEATPDEGPEEKPEKAEPYTDPYLVREKLTTFQLIDEMGIGINLGNTFEACGDWINPSRIENYETAWGSPVVTKELIEGYALAGFSSIRIPVHWTNLLGENDKVNADLLTKIDNVVRWALGCGLVDIVNMHHETDWIKQVPTDEAARKRYSSIWTQVAERLGKYGDHLLFESMNEVGYDEIWTTWGGGDKAKAFGYVNEINQLFVDTIRKSGGNNATRHLVIEVYNTGLEYAFDPLTKMPKDPAGRLALTVHYYTPANFAILGNGEDAGWAVGVPSWGTDAEKKELNSNMALLKIKCVDRGIPIIIGEFCASSTGRTQEVVRLFTVSVAEAAYKRGMCPMIWDAPGGQYNRETFRLNDDELRRELMKIQQKYPRE